MMRSSSAGPVLSIRHPALVGLCLAALGLAAPALADPAPISGPSPFSGCDVSAEPGVNYLNAEVEPWVDVNAGNPANLIAGWQQDRWSNGGSRSLMSAYSKNFGTTWTRVVIPGITKCSGGVGLMAFDRASDPWVSFAPNGTAYFMSLGFMNDETSGAGGDNAMLVSRSTDGGATWSAPQSLIYDTDGQIFNDKNALTADPANSNYAYAVWDRLIDYSLPHGNGHTRAQTASTNKHGDGVADARARLSAARADGAANPATIFTGPTYFARTTNGGISWEPATEIVTTGSNAQTIGNQIVVLPDGSVIDFFTHLTTWGWGGVKLGLVKSADKGATFGKVSHAFQMVETSNGTITPDSREAVRDANILFDVAVDSGNGNLYLVWQDGRWGNIDRVAFSMSTNGGVSWSPPALIAKTPYNANKRRMQSFIPSVEVAADHRVIVTYYDFRNDTATGGELTDYWAITCDPATANCRLPSGWGNETRLTASSFDMLNAPVARGHFLGDYMGLVKDGSGARAVFGIATGPNLNDIVTSLIP